MYSLATAAAACGVSKSVILRAIIAGKISGSKDKHGEWHVEPAPRYGHHRMQQPWQRRINGFP